MQIIGKASMEDMLYVYLQLTRFPQIMYTKDIKMNVHDIKNV